MTAAYAIEAEGLRKSFGDVEALSGADLAVPAGTVLGLLGPNGAGKTTAVRILTTLLPPDGGSARVASLDVVADATALRARIGLAGQHAAIEENLSGYENLAVGLIIGFSFQANIAEIVAGIGLLLLFGCAFSWIFALVGLSSSTPEAAQQVGFILIFPLTFASSAFVPLESMPSGLEAFAAVNPFTTIVDAMRALWLDQPAGNAIWGALAWSLA